MENEFIQSQHNSAPETSQSISKLEYLMLAVGIVGILWVIAGISTHALFAIQAPLTSEDVANASWLGSPTTALHFSKGPLAYAMMSVMLLIATTTAITKKTWQPVVVVALIVAGVFAGASEEAVMRIGILDDTIKLGCYVENTVECRTMLGLSSKNLKSMYTDSATRSKTGEVYAAWYLSAINNVVTEQQRDSIIYTIGPGLALLRAPIYATQGAQLKRKIESQRNDLKALRERPCGSFIAEK